MAHGQPEAAAPTAFEVLRGRVQAYLQGQRAVHAGPVSPAPTRRYRIRVRLVSSERLDHALFARNMFIRPTEPTSWWGSSRIT